MRTLESLTLAERCYALQDAEMDLFQKANIIMGCRPFAECSEPGYIFPVHDTWWDQYDSSVEVVLDDRTPPMTRHQADQLLALGFAAVYESRGDQGLCWTKTMVEATSARQADEGESARKKLTAQLNAALAKIAELTVAETEPTALELGAAVRRLGLQGQ